MKIAFDISAVIYGTGVSVYTKNLLENMAVMDRKDDFILFGGSLRRKNELDAFADSLMTENFTKKTFNIPPSVADIFWNKLHIVSLESLVESVDVYHSSDWAQAPSKAFKITTMHDLTPILHPSLADPRIVSVHQRRLQWVLKECDRVIVPSVATANDMVKIGYENSKIRVIPEAVDPGFKKAGIKEIKSLKRKLKIKGKYILSIGVNKRKNTDNIISAFRMLKKQADLTLVIVGHPYIGVKSENDIKFTGHIDQKYMPIILSAAEALVYPSFYEGFGLPILESFTCKTPVVTTGSGSMKEISGDAAVFVDPYDARSIKNGILEAISKRKMLTEKGLKIAGQYSWRRTAEETLKVYREHTQR